MVYREPDPKRALEVAEDAENRAQLERLAAAGLRKKRELVAEKNAAQLAIQSRTTSARFRARAWVKPRKFLFFFAWELACAIAGVLGAIVFLVVTRSLGDALGMAIVVFILANVSAIVGIPVMIVWSLYAAYWRHRDARDLLAWRGTLPFTVNRFVETLSLDHKLSSIRVAVRFTNDAPPVEIIDGLLGNVSEPDRTQVVAGTDAHDIVRIALSDGDDPGNDVVAFLRDVTQKVLLPLHAVHPIGSVTISEGV